MGIGFGELLEKLTQKMKDECLVKDSPDVHHMNMSVVYNHTTDNMSVYVV